MAACTSSAATTRPSTSTSIACGGSTLVRTNFIQLLVLRVFAFKTATLPSKSAKFRAKPRTVITTGVRGIFSGGGGGNNGFFQVGVSSGGVSFHPFETKRTTFFAKNFNRKISNLKIKGGEFPHGPLARDFHPNSCYTNSASLPFLYFLK